MTRLAPALLIQFLLSGALGTPLAFAAEGKWTPQQILELPPEELRALGLEIPPQRLWEEGKGGLLEATVRVPGCSAAFISPEGLLVTNHHCAFPILQQHSSSERDLISRGFLAADRSQEIPSTGQRATVPHRFTDVTAVIEASVPQDADDLARYRAIDLTSKELVEGCEKPGQRRCEVGVFDGGVGYLLVESLEFPDLRLVYAPPRGIGEYGGEVDNWSWPRHTGDFALLRVYAGPDNQPAAHAAQNLPYRPRHHFKVSREGVRKGSFVMVTGYPGKTYRSLTAAEADERALLHFSRRAELYRAWLDLMSRGAQTDEDARIRLAERIKDLANDEKNARGQVAGLRRGRLLEKKRAFEAQVLEWASRTPGHAAAIDAHRQLQSQIAEKARTWDRDFLVQHLRSGSRPLGMAITLVRWARERAKPDRERDPEYMERNRDRSRDRLRLDQKRFHLATDAVLLADFLLRLSRVPEQTRIPGVEPVLGSDHSIDAVQARLTALLAQSHVLDLDQRLAMFEESTEQLRARKDPLLDLGFELDAVIEANEERDHRWSGAVSRLRPTWRRAVMAFLGRPLDPDANGTLRVSLGHVQGYGPRDGLWCEPQTTLRGAVEKHTGEEPFDLDRKSVV